VGDRSSSSNNTALIGGNGSIWRTLNDLTVGYNGASNVMMILNGGNVYNDFGVLGVASTGSSNVVIVSGSGSVWSNSADLYVGYAGASNALTIASNSSVFAQGAYIGWAYTNAGNRITLAGGGLSVAIADVRRGSFTFNSGTLIVNQIVVTNGANSVFTFSGGMLNSGGTFVTNGQTFVVGDGTNAATFHFVGGTHGFASGLRVRSNSFLTGCGTINGDVVVDAGGAVLANCGGTLTFTGTVNNSGTMRALNGTVLESYGLIVNNGVIDVLNGNTNFHSTFINNGVIITTNSVPQITSIMTVGADVKITFTTGSSAPYAVDFSTNLVAGGWSTLSNNITGTGAAITVTDTSAALQARRFYRVRLVVP
jgi:T5SS/PEP-CTERM-associated repeat protein